MPCTTTVYVEAVMLDVELIFTVTTDADVLTLSTITSSPEVVSYTVTCTFFVPRLCVTVHVHNPPDCVNAGLVVEYFCTAVSALVP